MKDYKIFNTQTGLARLRSSFRSWFTRYIEEQAEVFESLTRQSAPYGGGCVASRLVGEVPVALERTGQQLARLEREVDELGKVMIRLHDQIDRLRRQPGASSSGSGEQSAVGAQSAAWKNKIGIDRFRALHPNA